MAGRRLIDAAKLFNASKSIAGKHVALRSQQLDVYSRTSTLAKAAKNQTERVTLTAEAAIALSKRFNEEIPSYVAAAASQASGSQNADIPRKDTVQGKNQSTDVKDGLEQDHHYERSGRNTQAETSSNEELGVQQEEAKRSPLPDGTIPSSGITLEEDGKGQDTYSERPIPEPPKQPLDEEHPQTAPTEEAGGIKPVGSDASTIPLPSKPSGISTDAAPDLDSAQSCIPSHTDDIQRQQSTPQAQKLTEGHDRDVFYTRSKESKPEPRLLPRADIPKYPGTKQESDDHVEDSRMNQDVYYATPEPGQVELQTEELPHEAAVPEQDQLPEGVNTDVFRTRRVARMLGGDPYATKPHLDLKGASQTPHDHTKLAAGHDQDTFNVRRSEETQPSAPEDQPQAATSSTEQEMHDFASQLAKDAEAAPSLVSEPRHRSPEK